MDGGDDAVWWLVVMYLHVLRVWYVHVHVQIREV